MKRGINDNTGYSNRVLDALRVYAEQDAQLKIANPRGYSSDRSDLQLKYLHYRNIYKAFKKGANREERKTLRYVRHERNKLRAKLRPNLFRRVRYSRIVDVMAGFLVGRYGMYKWHNQTLQNDQKDLLRTHNLNNLQDSIKKAGFNNSMEGPLQKMVDLNLLNFIYDTMTLCTVRIRIMCCTLRRFPNPISIISKNLMPLPDQPCSRCSSTIVHPSGKASLCSIT